jgi:hypothetical protein
LIVGLVVAASLAAVLLWVLLARQRRRAAVAAAAAETEYYAQDSKRRLSLGDAGRRDGNGLYGSSYCHSSGSKDRYPGRGFGPDGRPVADVAAVGSAAVQGLDQAGYSPQQQQQQQQQYLQDSPGWRSSPQSGGTNSGSGVGLISSSGLQGGSLDPGTSSSGGMGGPRDSISGGSMLGNKRWQKLTTAISSKVHDIHQQRLRTALMQSQPRGGGSMDSGMGLGGSSGGTSLCRAAAGGPSGSNNYGGGSSSSLQGSGPLGSFDSGTALQQGAEGANGRGQQQQQQQQGEQEDALADSQNVLELKELIGRGTFGTVYRWAPR